MLAPPPCIAKICRGQSFLGTGVLVSPTLVLTCEHVIQQIGPNTTLHVCLDGIESKAKLKPGSKDAKRDLALIELAAAVQAAPPAWSHQVARGHQCNALGFPGGEYESVSATVRDAQKRRIDLEQSLIEGSSGGALVRLIHDGGHCVGLLRRGGDGVISHAIGAEMVEEFLSEHGVALPAAPPPSPRLKAPNTAAYFEALRGKRARSIWTLLKFRAKEVSRRASMLCIFL